MKGNFYPRGESVSDTDFRSLKFLVGGKMIKKILISLVIISFLNYLGCYTSEIITKNEIDQGTKKINLKEVISISTKDYKSYSFGANQYQIQNDTLFGTGVITKLGKQIPFKGKIAMNDIVSIEQKSTDAVATIGLVLGIAALGALIFTLVVVTAVTNDITPD